MKFKIWIQKFNFYTCVIGMSLLLPLMFLTTADALGRKIWSKTIPGIFEISEYLLAIFILLGAGYTQQVKGHAGVEFFISRFPLRIRLICQMITIILSLFIIGIVFWQGLLEGMQEKTVSDMWRIPQYPFRLLVAVGGFSLWLELFFDLQETIIKFKRERTK